MLKRPSAVSHLAFASLVLQRQLLQLLQDVVLAAHKEHRLLFQRTADGPKSIKRRRSVDVLLIVVLLGSFLLLLPFWLLGGSGSLDLRRQSVNVNAVIFGTTGRFD